MDRINDQEEINILGASHYFGLCCWHLLAPTNAPVNTPPPRLRLSALAWAGYPRTWYAPAAPMLFVYQRHAHTMEYSSEDGAIPGGNIPPLTRICHPDRHLWPERFMEFKYWYPSQLEPRAVGLSPDLLGQLARDVEPRSTAGGELDSPRGVVWQGAWAVALLEEQARKELLGGEGDYKRIRHGLWKLAVRVVECEDYDDEMSEDEDKGEDTPNLSARGISDYEVRVTILQVFVVSRRQTLYTNARTSLYRVC
ncbi:hypothetical protein DFH09DRAFT_1086516 [Mycena vulgaris]|nr:hypothetical protein DFH09DRAFT_1086516 [Mycena vulgaris]